MVELYDLQNDPMEMTNLAGHTALADIEQTLQHALESWMVQEHDFLPLPSHALEHIR